MHNVLANFWAKPVSFSWKSFKFIIPLDQTPQLNLLCFLWLQGLKQKAEALYTKGNFEFALVFYQRGYKLRPEVKEFRLGIQKSQEAIENSIGGN